MASGLDLVGHLMILADDDRLRVEFLGDVVALDLPDLRTALALRRKLPRCERRAWLRRAQATLARADLELQVWVGRQQVGRLAAGTRPGRVAAWLGLDPMELKVRPLLTPVARRRPRSPGEEDTSGESPGG